MYVLSEVYDIPCKTSLFNKNISVSIGVIQMDGGVIKHQDVERFDKESDMNRGEHYVRQKRRARYWV